MEKQNFTDLIQKAKDNSQPKTIQKVVTVKDMGSDFFVILYRLF